MEALLRGWEGEGVAGIHELFDRAFAQRSLYALDLELRKLAIRDFAMSAFSAHSRLFYNLDNRVLIMPDYAPGNTARLLAPWGLTPKSVAFEISERHEVGNWPLTHAVLSQYKGENYLLALDDFGAGFSGLQLLYHAEPHIIKIDRFFIAGIDHDARKQFFVQNIVEMAHVMEILVIAEGVETSSELEACRRIGADLVQGYHVARPAPIEDLAVFYDVGAFGISQREFAFS